MDWSWTMTRATLVCKISPRGVFGVAVHGGWGTVRFWHFVKAFSSREGGVDGDEHVQGVFYHVEKRLVLRFALCFVLVDLMVSCKLPRIE